MSDYLRQITDLHNTAADAASLLTTQAGEIETLQAELERARGRIEDLERQLAAERSSCACPDHMRDHA